MKNAITQEEHEALERLLKIAKNDTGQSQRVRNFLLAWWNARELGGFDLTDFWSLDTKIVNDMFRIISLIARDRSYPDTYGYGTQFEAMAARRIEARIEARIEERNQSEYTDQ